MKQKTRKKSVNKPKQTKSRSRKDSRKKSSFQKGYSRWGGSSQNSPRRITWMPAGRDFRPPFVPFESLRVKVSKEMEWVLPFLEKTHQILPRLQMPVQINSYRPSLSRRLRTLGTSYYDEGIVNLASHFQIIERKQNTRIIKGLKRIPRRKILETLAHELAHLHVVEHNFEHAEMTRTIFRTFGLTRLCPQCEGKGKIDVECDPF